MNKIYKLQQLLATIILLCATAPALANTGIMQQLYNSASKQDPAWLEANQNYAITSEAVPQAKSLLLPSLSLQARGNRYWQRVDANSPPPFGGVQDLSYNSSQLALEVRQTIYDRDRYLALSQARQEVGEGDARLQLARQQLILRLATATFDILSASEDLAVVYSERYALERQLQQAEQRLEIGLGTRIDVEEARAAHDLAKASVLAAENSQAVALERLREISTDPIGTKLLEHELDQEMPLSPPQPPEREYWIDTAFANNFEVRVAEKLLAQAEEQIQRAQSGHYPRLDLVGSQSFDSTGGRFGATDTNTTRLGLELNLPIYAGGSVNSSVRATVAQRDAAKARLEQARRNISRNTSETYLNLLNNIKRSEALRQAVLSSEAALDAVRTGFEIGTRNSVDVVTAERSLSSAKRDLANARHTYVLGFIRLYMAAGTLEQKHLTAIDQWLAKRTTNNSTH